MVYIQQVPAIWNAVLASSDRSLCVLYWPWKNNFLKTVPRWLTFIIHHHQLTSINWFSKTKILLQWYWSFLITTNSSDSADQKTQILNSKYQTKGPGNLWGTLEHSSETWQAKPPPSASLSALSSKSSLNSEAPDSFPNRKLPNPFDIIPRTMPSGLPSKAPLLVQFQPSLLFML